MVSEVFGVAFLRRTAEVEAARDDRAGVDYDDPVVGDGVVVINVDRHPLIVEKVAYLSYTSRSANLNMICNHPPRRKAMFIQSLIPVLPVDGIPDVLFFIKLGQSNSSGPFSMICIDCK